MLMNVSWAVTAVSKCVSMFRGRTNVRAISGTRPSLTLLVKVSHPSMFRNQRRKSDPFTTFGQFVVKFSRAILL